MKTPDAKTIAEWREIEANLRELTARVKRQVEAFQEVDTPFKHLPQPCDVRAGVFTALETRLLVALDTLLSAVEKGIVLDEPIGFAKRASRIAHEELETRMQKER